MITSSDYLKSRPLSSYVIVGFLFVLWGYIYFDALLSAISIWYESEIFSHGFFIIPGSFYLIWRERDKLKTCDVKTNYWVLPLLLCFLLLGVFGNVGGIQVFSHISAFTVLPIAIWFCAGNQVAKVIWFPLLFMLFSIPIGEQLIPYLQQITADLAIGILNLTSIPSYNTGLYIEIPQGKFVVAEACSGIRFFVGSLVFGAVYSHLSYRSFSRKALFMLLALVVPIIANALRVFGIVVIGYFSDMKYAAGADHIIYGWVFFSIVLFLLVVVGETLREKGELESKPGDESLDVQQSFPFIASVALFGVFVSVLIWQHLVSFGSTPGVSAIDKSVLSEIANEERNSFMQTWRVVVSGESDLYIGRAKNTDQISLSNASVDLVLAWYSENRNGAELVSSSNALYDKELWSKVGSETIYLEIDGIAGGAQLLKIVSLSGVERLVLYWYQLPDELLSSQIKTKLFQSVDVLFGGSGSGALIAISSAYDKRNEQAVREELLKIAQQSGANIYKALPF